MTPGADDEAVTVLRAGECLEPAQQELLAASETDEDTTPVLQPANEPQFDAEFLEQLAERIADKVAEKVAAKLGARVQPSQTRSLLSMRETAKRLGVSRTTTLPALIAHRRIRTVTVNGKKRIPLSEVQRVEHEGTGRIATASPTPRHYPDAPLVEEMLAEMAARHPRGPGSRKPTA